MPITLTDDEVEKIKLEEQCRQRIRETLEGQAPSVGAKIWRFLNSAFALWFLSAVLVSVAGHTYAKWSEARETERKRVATCEALDLEIGYRLSFALISLYRVQTTYDEALHDRS